MMPVRLRGHHFLCVLTYRGAGYSELFVVNMTAKVAAIRAGAPVLLVEGPDDVCNGFTDACRAACDHDCTAQDTLEMDRVAVKAVEALLKRSLVGPLPLTKRDLALLREAYKLKTIRAACADCSWKDFCDQIADADFAGTML